MAGLPISVCIIAKNEEKYIEQCLRSLLPYSMEIIVVDTGSTDRTKEIAAKYTSKVYDFTWISDFSAARNYAGQQASNNWILVLDCDECVKHIDVKTLRQCMQQHLRHVGMLRLKNQRTNENGEKSFRLDEVPRFYNKNFFEYRFRIHEQITPKNQKNLEEVKLLTYALPMEVEHYGYDISPEEMLRKQERNLSMLESALGETPFDDYLYFQIGQSYYIMGRREEAKAAYEQCFAQNDDIEKGFMRIAVPNYAKLLLAMGRQEEALQHLLRYEKAFPTADNIFLLGSAYEACGDLLRALLTYVRVTQMPDIDKLGEDAYETFVRIIRLHNKDGNQEGMEHFKERLQQYGLAHGRKIVFS